MIGQAWATDSLKSGSKMINHIQTNSHILFNSIKYLPTITLVAVIGSPIPMVPSSSILQFLNRLGQHNASGYNILGMGYLSLFIGTSKAADFFIIGHSPAFKQTFLFIQQINVKNYPSCIWCRGSHF